MSAPVPADPASDVIDVCMRAMKAAFNPEDSIQPPLGGGSTDVRFFAGDGALPDWDPQPSGESMFLWVRAANRYRSKLRDFPAAFVGLGQYANAADAFSVLAVELGVARCTSMESECNWGTLADEAAISLDDSWRIERALCAVAAHLRKNNTAVAIDTIAPIGPEGGIIAWTAMAYAQI